MDYKELFPKHGIPFGDIDKEFIELLYVLNFKLDLELAPAVLAMTRKLA